MREMKPTRIEVRLRELAQLFNSLDPSPFFDRDLDDEAEEFIVGWARELPHHGALELWIHVATPPPEQSLVGVEAAVRHYFANRAELKRRELRLLLRRGRVSFVIGIVFLAACFGAGQLAREVLPMHWNDFVELGFQIVGWVAMWRPIEIFLYDWWPIRSDRRLFERLAQMQVRVRTGAASDAPGKL